MLLPLVEDANVGPGRVSHPRSDLKLWKLDSECMLVVTTSLSVDTAATDTAAATISSSQSVILIVFRIHAHTVWPRSPIRAVCTLVAFLLVVFLWLTHSSAVLI